MKRLLKLILKLSSLLLLIGVTPGLRAQTNGCAPAPVGIVGLWKGEDATDSVSGSYGMLMNGVSFVPGEVAQAFYFNGDNSYLEAADSPALRVTNELSIEFWVRRLRFDDSVEYCVEKGGDWTWGEQNYGVALNRQSFGNCLSFHFAGGWRGAGSVSDGNWHHCAVTARNGDADPTFYIDGLAQPVVYRDGSASLLLYPSTRPLHVGAQIDPVSGWNYYGFVLLDEVAIYNRILSVEQIQVIYNASRAGKCAELPISPTILVQPTNQTVNAGGTVRFSVDVRSMSPLIYQWWCGSQIVTNATNSLLAFYNVQPSDAGIYSVAVTNAYGSVTSSNALLAVLTYPPSILSQPRSVTTYQGDDVLLRIQATGTVPLRYQWYHEDAPIMSGGQSTNLSLTNVPFSAAGNYSVTVSNAYGFVSSSNATLTVLTPPDCVPPPQGIVAWWRAENNAMDSVGINDLVWSTQSPASWGNYSPGKVGSAFGSPYGPVPAYALASPELDLGAGPGFSIECWMSLRSGYSRGLIPLVTWQGTNFLRGTYLQFALDGQAPPYVLKAIFTDTNSTLPRSTQFQSAPLVTVTDWQHVALTFDRASGWAMLYYNGAEVARTNLGAFTPETLASVRLGADSALLQDELSLYNRALRSDEIYSIFAADRAGKCVPPPPACQPAPPGIVGWWRGQSNALDSVNGNNGVISNSVTYTNGAVGATFRLANGFIRVPANSNLDAGTGPGFTVEMWVRAEFPMGSSVGSLARWGTAGTELTIRGPYHTVSPIFPLPSTLSATLVDTQGIPHTFSSSSGVTSASDWQHVALTYDKASGKAAIYLNGHSVGETNCGSLAPRTTGDLNFGRASTSIGAFVGALDDIAIYNRALTEAEIGSIVAARGSGKCAEAPAILDQPQSLTVNLGQPAAFNVTANGTPFLHYQWFFNGNLVSNATDAVYALSAAQTNDAGIYSVIVSNQLGVVTSSNALLRVNLPPVADASATALVAISCNGSNATAILNGSKSSDPDGDVLQYTWLENNTALATGVVAVVQLQVGTNAITLQVSDGLAADTHTVIVEVIPTTQAVQRLIDRVSSEVDPPRPLIAILEATRNAMQHGHCVAAIAELRGFQIVVHVQVDRQDPALATSLISAAEQIIDAAEVCCQGHERQRLFPRIRHDHGRPQIEFAAVPGRVYLIESSSDLVHWQKIGVATDHHDGNFSFEDTGPMQPAARFYRIVPAQ